MTTLSPQFLTRLGNQGIDLPSWAFGNPQPITADRVGGAQTGRGA